MVIHMVKLVVNHNYAVEASNIIKLFYGKTQIEVAELEALENTQSFFQADDIVLYSLIRTAYVTVHAKAAINSKENINEYSEEFEFVTEKQQKEAVKLTMYKLLSKLHGKSYPWGILTGIRPLKIIHDLMDQGYEKNDIIRFLQNKHLVSLEKAHLAVEIAVTERKFIYPTDSRMVSIYIGIPFCPTRCHYCSFTSNSLVSCGSIVEDYLNALFYEMEQTKEIMNKYNLKVQTIYIGGGTPTSLDEDQLDRLLAKVTALYGVGQEFTCEAGRPDTITVRKLKIMKEKGVTRISINPQTMNDETLEKIGRSHSTKQTMDSFYLARKMGFNNINMDIILGLPGENMEHLEHTLSMIGELEPESLTVHTMAVKRASIINDTGADYLQEGKTAAMMKAASDFARNNHMQPYYLYRQKHMVENLENIGYSKPGYECIYNMQIIEEKQTNIAFGADAITKAVYIDENRIERQGNIKDLRLYIARIQEQIDKKKELLEELYANC